MLIQIFCRTYSLILWYNFTENVISYSVGNSDYLPQVSLHYIVYCPVNNDLCILVLLSSLLFVCISHHEIFIINVNVNVTAFMYHAGLITQL